MRIPTEILAASELRSRFRSKSAAAVHFKSDILMWIHFAVNLAFRSPTIRLFCFHELCFHYENTPIQIY